MQGLLKLQPMVSTSIAGRDSSKATGTYLLGKAYNEISPPASSFQLTTNRVPTAIQVTARPSNFQMQPQTLTYKQMSDPRLCEGELMADRYYIDNYRGDEESASVSLSEMVDGFIEGECEIRNCGRARCTCESGANNKDGCSDTRDGNRFFENSPNAVEALILGISNAERTLLDTIRRLIKKVKERVCVCGATNWSNGCLKWSLMNEMRNLGYNAAICKSKWEPAAEYPGGTYEYLDVVAEISLNTQKKERIIVDIEFLEHFEIARPTRQYRATLNTLPSIFVGSRDHLQKILSIMSGAAKRSLDEREMYLPPWRRREYMEAKWFSTYSRISTESEHIYETQTKHLLIFAEAELNTHPNSEVSYGIAEAMTTRTDSRKSETTWKKCGRHRCEDSESKKSSKSPYNGGRYELSVVSTDWEPPPVQPKASQRFRKVAGLASVIGMTEASVQIKEQKNVASALILPGICREVLSSAEIWSKANPRNIHTRRTWIHL